MEALLITTYGKSQNINIVSFDEAIQIVTDFNYEGNICLIESGNKQQENKAMLVDRSQGYKELRCNARATKMAIELNFILQGETLQGDILFIDNIEDFKSLQNIQPSDML